MKKITIAALVATVAVMSMTGISYADNGVAEQNQDQTLTQESKFHCEHGSYGEITSCDFYSKNEGTQSQSQKVVFRNGRYTKIHVPVDTAMNMQTTAMIMAIAFIGLGAAVALRRMA